MKRIIVIGCPGSGKSTFSRTLSDITGIPLYHLDMMYWNVDKTIVDKSVFMKRLLGVMETDEWIIDGNYGSTMEMRMQACDTIFFLDYPLEVCLEGIRARKGTVRTDMPWVEDEVDEEFIEFIKDYNSSSRPIVMELLEKYSGKDIFVFENRSEAEEYLRELSQKQFDDRTVNRIYQMEKYYDEVLLAIKNSPKSIIKDKELRKKIEVLKDYSDSGRWLKDYEADERGELPVDLKRGVLSQDGLYNLLCEIGECIEEAENES